MRRRIVAVGTGVKEGNVTYLANWINWENSDNSRDPGDKERTGLSDLVNKID